MGEIHWVGFSSAINLKVNEVTEDPTRVSCPLCLEWMKRNASTQESS